jgi:GT2 family glycosyltransferase/glycosyltransferase involved in cell wall biosynthesis
VVLAGRAVVGAGSGLAERGFSVVTNSADDSSTVLRGLLARVVAAARAGDLAAAYRYADAAWRRAPDSPDVLRLLGRLSLRCGHGERAVALLETASERQGGADAEADLIEALLSQGQPGEAAGRLEAALHRYAVDQGDRLSAAAQAVMAVLPSTVPGWIGISSSLDVWGQIREDEPTRSGLETEGGLTLSIGRSAPAKGWLRFSGSLPTPLNNPLSLRIVGHRLIGVTVWPPPDFGVDGRARLAPGRLTGWVQMSWAPALTPQLMVRDLEGRDFAAMVEPDPREPGRYSYQVRWPNHKAPKGEIAVSVRTPSGALEPLPDSPAPIELPPVPAPIDPFTWAGSTSTAAPAGSREVDIVIPVYRGLRETLDCIASVQATVGGEAHMLVIDDCSPEPALSAALDRLAAAGRITLRRNPTNLGFPASVNQAVDLHPERDVVLLNADAEVFPGWLRRLAKVARSAPDVGTVTPLTNSGSIASYPPGEAQCSRERGAELARLAAQANEGVAIDAPTGVGFCMYIRRECLDQTGPFDAKAFRSGYGEENDFCQRSSALGWRHLIAPEVFVRHAGGRSFGRRREALMERNIEILARRYPDYRRQVEAFHLADPLGSARRRIDEAGVRAQAASHVLLVNQDFQGGVERFAQERVEHWRDKGLSVLMVRPRDGSVRIEVCDPQWPCEINYSIEGELDAFGSFVRNLRIKQVEFHHYRDIPEIFIENILNLDVPYDVFLHDYSWICPRITLIGHQGKFCAEPDLEACETCAAHPEGLRLERRLTVAALRRRSDHWLEGARAIVAPTRDVASRFRRYFPDRLVEVQPWEALALALDPPPPVAPDRVVRVAVIGAIGEHKGYSVLLDCARDAVERCLPIEFVVFGYTEDDDVLLKTGAVFITGEYEDAEIAGLISRDAPDVSLFASICPETWCFALTHALRADLPVLAFDIGAIAERLRLSAHPHELVALGAAPALINDQLLAIARRRRRGSAPLQAGPDAAPGAPRETVHQPDRVQLSQATPEPRPTQMETQSSMLSVTAEILPLAKGIYQFSVRSATPKRVGEDGELILPAIHVGLGPGVPLENAEIMTGLHNSGAWLCEQRDLLVMKVKAGPTLVILTSVRSEGMAPLEITVERLDNRQRKARAPAPAAAAAAPPAPLALQAPAALGAAPKQALPIEVMAHISNRGDVAFADGYWAGAPAEGLPIEAFQIRAREGIAPKDLEYKALTASGVETPWVSSGEFCGTRGAGLPLVGFAVRTKGDGGEEFDCEYRGAFRSGKIVGPVTNGAPCRSTEREDPLVAVQLTIVRRSKATKFAARAEPPPTAPERVQEPARKIGPKFSVFRQEA